MISAARHIAGRCCGVITITFRCAACPSVWVKKQPNRIFGPVSLKLRAALISCRGSGMTRAVQLERSSNVCFPHIAYCRSDPRDGCATATGAVGHGTGGHGRHLCRHLGIAAQELCTDDRATDSRRPGRPACVLRPPRHRPERLELGRHGLRRALRRQCLPGWLRSARAAAWWCQAADRDQGARLRHQWGADHGTRTASASSRM